jgi:hypothetical protein
MQPIEQIEVDIETAEKAQALRDQCVKLLDNEHFKVIIEEEYFQKEAARLTMAKSSDLNDQQMRNIENMMYGVGSLRNFLSAIMIRGAQMDQSLKQDEETREEMLAEEIENHG